jgi:integrase
MASNKAFKASLPRVDATQQPMERPVTHTIKRGSVYYFRRRIPLDLIAAHDGQREVTYSLKTKDRSEAERRARKASVALDDEWTRTRTNLRAQLPREIRTDWDLAEAPGGTVRVVPPSRDGRLKQEPVTMTQEEFEQAEYEHQLGAEEDEREWNAADAEADKVIAALRLKGLTLHPAQEQGPPRPASMTSTTLDTLVEHWERERKPSSKTVAKMKLAALEFNLLHKDPAVETISRPMVIAYRTHLLTQSANNGKPKFAKGTIDDRLSSIGTLLALAADHGYVVANVAARAALQPDKLATKRRIGYSSAQTFAVMAGTEQYREAYPARYWLPRLARWTGARLNELHQLRRIDLKERDGIRGINIIDEGEHAEGVPMRMKNAASRRWVPLHPSISDFWSWAAAQVDGALFPALPDKHGIVSTEFSKWYGRQLRGTWGIKDKRVTFHGWRHNFADMCRAAGVQDSLRYSLMGHAESGAAGGYGGTLPAKVLAEAICKLT